MKAEKLFFPIFYFMVFGFPFFKGAFGDDYNYLLHICVILLLTLFLLHLFSGGGVKRVKPVTFLPWCLFLFFCFVSVYFSVSPRESLKELMLLCDYFAVYIMLSLLPYSIMEIKKFHLAQIAASGLLSLYACSQILFFFPVIAENPLAKAMGAGTPQRAFSTFIHHNIFAAFLAMSSLLLLGYYKTCGNRIARLLLNIILILNMLSLFLTFSYGVALIFFSVLVLYVILSGERKHDGTHLLYIGAVSVMCMVLFVYASSSAHHDISKDVALLTNSKIKMSSFAGRVSLWRTAIYAGRHYIFTGSGLRTFNMAALQFRKDAMYSLYPHNVFVQMFCETGLPGVLMLIWLMAYSAQRGLRVLFSSRHSSDEPLYRGIFLCMMFFALHNLIDFDWNIPLLPFLFFTLSGMLNSVSLYDGKTLNVNLTAVRGVVHKAALICAMCLLVMLALLASSKFYAYHNFQRAYFLCLRKDFGKAGIVLSDNERMLDWEADFHSLYARVYEGLGDINKATMQSERASLLEPEKVSYHGQSAHLNLLSGEKEKAKAHLKQALILCPFCVDYMYGLSQVAVLEGNMQEAKRMINKAMYILPYYERLGALPRAYLALFLLCGDIRYGERNIRFAATCYRKADKYFPANSEVRKRLELLKGENEK